MGKRKKELNYISLRAWVMMIWFADDDDLRAFSLSLLVCIFLHSMCTRLREWERPWYQAVQRWRSGGGALRGRKADELLIMFGCGSRRFHPDHHHHVSVSLCVSVCVCVRGRYKINSHVWLIQMCICRFKCSIFIYAQLWERMTMLRDAGHLHQKEKFFSGKREKGKYASMTLNIFALDIWFTMKNTV